MDQQIRFTNVTFKRLDIVEYVGEDNLKLQYGSPWLIQGWYNEDRVLLARISWFDLTYDPGKIARLADGLVTDLDISQDDLDKYFRYHAHWGFTPMPQE